MTEKLFENNALLKSCQAAVTSCTLDEKSGQYFIETDKTVFFPEGGGQLSDKGKLGEAKVLHVSEKDGHIYHECDKPLEVGATVEAVLDWPVRLDRMQQHLGEHLLSYACWKLYKANNVGFHMNEDDVTIDLDKELTEEELLKAELYTNEIIWDNRPVHINYMDSSEAVVLKDKMRKFNSKLTGLLRIVSVEDADICTCCGTHPPFTGMVGGVKIIRAEKHKQGQRIEFLCGRRALLDADKKNSILLGVAASLSAKPEAVPERVNKLKEELAAAIAEAKARMAAVMLQQMSEAAEQAPTSSKGYKVLCYPMENFDGKDLKALLSKAAELENTLSVLVAVAPERISYAILQGANTDVDCRAISKIVNEAFNGRGGGKPDCVQGGAPYDEGWRERLEVVLQKLL